MGPYLIELTGFVNIKSELQKSMMSNKFVVRVHHYVKSSTLCNICSLFNIYWVTSVIIHYEEMRNCCHPYQMCWNKYICPWLYIFLQTSTTSIFLLYVDTS